MAPRCLLNVQTNNNNKNTEKRRTTTLSLSRKKSKQIVPYNWKLSTSTRNLLIDVNINKKFFIIRRKKNVNKDNLSLLKRRLAMIGLKTDINTTSITNYPSNSLPSLTPHHHNNINSSRHNSILKRTKFIEKHSSSPILEASTLSVNTGVATTVGPASLFISSTSGHVVQSTTSAAAAAAALTSAVTHDVATSSVSSTVTQTPVTGDIYFTSLFIELKNKQKIVA
jgi:hypothetical protein